MNRAIGRSWEEIEREIFTPEEIAEAELKASIISELIKARNERKLSQRDLEKLSGVSQAVIARMEKGNTKTQFDTVVKLLKALGKTLVVAPLNS